MGRIKTLLCYTDSNRRSDIVKKLFFGGLLTLMIIPNVVSAATFSNGNTNYVIEESTLSCSLNENARLRDIMDDYYLFGDSINLYKLDFEGNCSAFSDQDYLDLSSTKGYGALFNNHGYYESDGNIIEYWENSLGSYYFKTTDTTIDNEKKYYIIDVNNGYVFAEEEDPQISNIDNYYEESYFKVPTSTLIDNDITYYEFVERSDTSPQYVRKVENPTSVYMFSDIRGFRVLNYYIKMEENGFEEEVVTTIDQTKFPAGIITDVFGEDDKLFLKIDNSIYDLNGNLIEELEGAIGISIIENNLLLVEYASSEQKFYNYNYEELHTQRGVYFVGNIGNINYLARYELRSYKEKIQLLIILIIMI